LASRTGTQARDALPVIDAITIKRFNPNVEREFCMFASQEQRATIYSFRILLTLAFMAFVDTDSTRSSERK